MTAILPELHDVTGLDFETTCDAYAHNCPQTAEWRIELHCSGCGRRLMVLFCGEHKRRVERDMERRKLFDLQCDGKPPIVLDSVEPLR